jgi:hypothetical protein
MSRQHSVKRLDMSHSVPGSNFHSTNLDLVLATLIALGLPFACQWLFDHTGGALIALLLYYGVCCIAAVWWRKGTLDYRWPQRWPWVLFICSLLVPVAIASLNYGALPTYHAPLPGFLLTILIWVPLNAAMGQLSWFYVSDLFHPFAGRSATGITSPLFDLSISDLRHSYTQREQQFYLSLLPLFEMNVCN